MIMSSYVEYKRNKAKTENAKRIKMQKSLEKRMHILEKGMRRGQVYGYDQGPA